MGTKVNAIPHRNLEMFIPHTTSQRLLRIYERGKKQYKCDNSKFHMQHSSRFETRTPKQSKCRNKNPCDALQNTIFDRHDKSATDFRFPIFLTEDTI